jgi:signal recognition particle receptor subunit beta
MSSINLHTKEINIKVVYYGPGLGGKTTSLQFIHRTLKPEMRGQLVSLATGIDRTLYFDFLPVKLPKVKDFNIKMSIYTVPGQVHYNATRKLVLQGCDGVVFVADSQPARKDANLESVRNLEENLRAQGMDPAETPLIFEYNKRDLPGVMSGQQMAADLNPRGLPHFSTCALTGQGIFEALKTIAKLVLSDLKRKGIYQGSAKSKPKVSETKAAKSPSAFERAPVVNASVERSLVQVIEKQRPEAPAAASAQPARSPVGVLSLQALWPPGAIRDAVMAIEKDFSAGAFKACIQRAAGLFSRVAGKTDAGEENPAEVMLMLGVYGPHYARFRRSLEAVEPGAEDVLFCLFFLADVELRMQAIGLRTES